MGVEATVDGLATLARSLDAAADELSDLAQVNVHAADLVVRAVEAPRITGRLDDSVTSFVDADGFTLTATAPYAPYVHARNPFLTRALSDRELAVIELYEDHVTETVNTIRGA